MTLIELILLIIAIIVVASGMFYIVCEQLIKFGIKCHFVEKEEYHRRIVELGMEDSNSINVN